MISVCFDEQSKSVNTSNQKIGNSKLSFRDLVKDSYDYISKYLSLLNSVDQSIAYHYFMDELKQEQIGKILGISQVAVSNRLYYIKSKLKFHLQQPSLNPIEVRMDFEKIFPKEHFESAFYFYWETSQSRVKYLIEMGQSAVANKLSRIIRYLEEEKNQLEQGGLVTEEEEIRYCSIVLYLDYFNYIRKNNSVHKCIFKKNDGYRANTLYLGKDVTKI